MVRTIMILQRKFAEIVNLVCRKELVPLKITDSAVEDFYSRKADVNVYITGSGFMNAESELETLPRKKVEEKKYYQRKPYLLGCNFGPYFHDEYLEMYKELFMDVSDLCFRDTHSLSMFSNIKQARWAPDIVFNYDKNTIEKLHCNNYKEYMLISVANLNKDNDSASGYYHSYLDFVRKIVQHRNKLKLHTVLVGFCNSQKDDETIHEILREIEDNEYNHIYCYPDVTKDVILSLFKSCDSVLATRYHAMILALLFEKKVCTVCYNEKTVNVIKDIDVHMPYIMLEELNELLPEQIDSKMYQVDKKKINVLIKTSQSHFRELDKELK